MARWLTTLGDARDIGQELVAVCHNVACRAQRFVDLEKVIHHVGAAHFLLPVRGAVHFSERMRCPACGSRGAFIWINEPKTPSPWFGNAEQSQVNLWGQFNDNTLETVVARTSRLEIGYAAYEGAVATYPRRHITLQEGSHVILDSRLKVIKGGRQVR